MEVGRQLQVVQLPQHAGVDGARRVAVPPQRPGTRILRRRRDILARQDRRHRDRSEQPVDRCASEIGPVPVLGVRVAEARHLRQLRLGFGVLSTRAAVAGGDFVGARL